MGMQKSCKYCGMTHPDGFICPQRPRYDARPRNSQADRFRRSRKWKKKRDYIVSRDYSMCRVCQDGKYGTYAGSNYTSTGLSVHHIEPLEERYDMRLEDGNLITCCSFHHRMAEDGGISREYLHELAGTPPRWSSGLCGNDCIPNSR